MKTLNDLFTKSVCTKNICEFSEFSLNASQMNSIKGGTDPIAVNPFKPIVPPIGNI